jgi:hypothetical protein
MRLPSWYSRRLLLAGLIGLVLIVSLFVFINPFRSNDQSEIDEKTNSVEKSAINKRSQRVFVQDFYKIQDFIDPQTQRFIEHTMYSYLIENQPDLYTGTIRAGSYSDKTDQKGISTTKLLIDIEPSMVSYEITMNANRKTDFQTVDIRCAPEEQQVDPSADCKDGDGRE